jgi:DNA polymerase III subunit gamma/tau
VLGKSYSLGPYRKPEKNEAEEDPLAVLAKKAEAEGIEVIKK